jgi:phospholipid/cholesterol/gamma-HCH transport system ATP-binding protein
MGLIKPDKGEILVDGVDIVPYDEFELNDIRKKFGMIWQYSALWDSMTVFENVAFPLREKTRLSGADIAKRVDTALERVGLEGVGNKYPEEVSGGMRKRVAFARALVTEPEIVFFDEPTTGLDPVLVNTIHRLIQELHRRSGFTAIMVSHEIPEVFDLADRVGMLHEGRIVEIGPPAAIQGSTNPIVQQFIRGEPGTEP